MRDHGVDATAVGVAFFLGPAMLMSACQGAAAQSATIYADGNIQCPDLFAGADEGDDPLPVGEVTFEAGPGQVLVTVTLVDAAPETEYYVEVWSEASCDLLEPLGGYGGPIAGVMTDENGSGEVAVTVSDLEAGPHMLNVDVVTQSDDLADPRHREIAASSFTEVVVDPAGS